MRATPKTKRKSANIMSGNLCRCAAYPNIVDAIKQAKAEMKESLTCGRSF